MARNSPPQAARSAAVHAAGHERNKNKRLQREQYALGKSRTMAPKDYERYYSMGANGGGYHREKRTRPTRNGGGAEQARKQKPDRDARSSATPRAREARRKKRSNSRRRPPIAAIGGRRRKGTERHPSSGRKSSQRRCRRPPETTYMGEQKHKPKRQYKCIPVLQNEITMAHFLNRSENEERKELQTEQNKIPEKEKHRSKEKHRDRGKINRTTAD